MTDVWNTQISLEQYASASPNVQCTQAVLEHWASVQTGPTTATATIVLLEQWGSVATIPVGGTQAARAWILA